MKKCMATLNVGKYLPQSLNRRIIIYGEKR